MVRKNSPVVTLRPDHVAAKLTLFDQCAARQNPDNLRFRDRRHEQAFLHAPARVDFDEDILPVAVRVDMSREDSRFTA